MKTLISIATNLTALFSLCFSGIYRYGVHGSYFLLVLCIFLSTKIPEAYIVHLLAVMLQRVSFSLAVVVFAAIRMTYIFLNLSRNFTRLYIYTISCFKAFLPRQYYLCLNIEVDFRYSGFKVFLDNLFIDLF